MIFKIQNTKNVRSKKPSIISTYTESIIAGMCMCVESRFVSGVYSFTTNCYWTSQQIVIEHHYNEQLACLNNIEIKVWAIKWAEFVVWQALHMIHATAMGSSTFFFFFLDYIICFPPCNNPSLVNASNQSWRYSKIPWRIIFMTE